MSTQTHVSPKRPNETDLGYSRRIAETKHTLIAAAPDLLAALEQALPFVIAHANKSGEGVGTVQVARAAISKAEAAK
jgi:hypothetical protein